MKIETVSNKYKSEEKYEKKVASTSVSKFKIENFKVGENVKLNISTYRQGYGNVMGSDENSGDRTLTRANWVVQEIKVTKVGAKLTPEPSI